MPESGQPARDQPRQPADGTPEPAVAAGGTEQFGWPDADGDTGDPQWPTVELPTPDGVKVSEQDTAPVPEPETLEQAVPAAEEPAEADQSPPAEAPDPQVDKPAEAAEPAEVDEPAEPAEPVAVSEPAEPDKSEEPAEPAEAAEPAETAEPAEAEEPAVKAELTTKIAAPAKPTAAEIEQPATPVTKATPPAPPPPAPPTPLAAPPAKPTPPPAPPLPAPTAKPTPPPPPPAKPVPPAQATKPVPPVAPAAETTRPVPSSPPSPPPAKPMPPAAPPTAKFNAFAAPPVRPTPSPRPTPPPPPPPRPAAPARPVPPPERPAEQTTKFAAIAAPSKEPETLRIKLADVQAVSPVEDTVSIPVDNDRARLDPPTIQLPNPADLRRGDETPTIRVKVPRPPAAGRPELGDDVPQPAPQLPPPPRTSEENNIAEAAPRRSRKGLFVGLAIVLVLALGAGVYFGTSGFDFGGPTIVATAPPPSPQAPNALIKPLTDAPTPSTAGLAAALAGPTASPALGTLTGTVIDPATGTTLWDHNSATPLTPASSGKLLTMTAALLSLDPQFRFTTTVVAGPDPGTVIVVGGGDPTLSSLPVGKESVYPGAAHLDDLVAQVKKAAGGAVQKVLLDTSRYSGDPMAPGWENSDIAGGSVTPITPFMLDGGRGKPTVSETARTATPDTDAAKEFARRLGADPNSVAKTTAPAGAKVLGSVQSPPLTDMITNLLQISDNVLAEAVGREVAKQAGAPASFADGAGNVLNILRNNNFDLTGVTMVDGSGLSTQDRVTAKLLGSIMAVAAGPDGGGDQRVAKLRPLLTGLPVAGGSGTLSDRYNDAASSSGKGWVRAKTGTLDGVNTLTGIVQDTDGKVLAFALMSNGSQIDPGRAALDDVAAALRGCGCR